MSREIDDVYKRRRMRDESLGGRRSTTDEYTGNRVFRQTDSNSRYQHPSDKVVNMDHITPVKRINDRYGDLSVEQRRNLANDRHNLASTNESMNKSKGSRTNTEYLANKIRSGERVEPRTATRMVGKQVESEVHMGVQATGYRVRNIFDKKK